MTVYVLAMANADKAREIRQILGPGIELADRPAEVPDVEETGDTLADNARLKAVALVEATGMAAIADDTGLEVDALGGAPGVRSARYAGEGASYGDNVAKLIEALRDVEGDGRRAARFATVAIALWPDGTERTGRGTVEGWIAESPRGGGGFGYDPVFVPAEGDGRTFAEMETDAKHRLSHRGRALRALLDELP